MGNQDRPDPAVAEAAAEMVATRIRRQAASGQRQETRIIAGAAVFEDAVYVAGDLNIGHD